MALFNKKTKEEKELHKQVSKKPIYKKWWFWIIIVFIVIAAFGNSGDKYRERISDVDKTSAYETASSTETTEIASTSSPLDFDVTFSSTFKNDTTGRWRKSLVSTNREIQEYALDYYHEYFKSDNEVHVIYNFSLNTVNCLTVNGDTLFISMTDYVDGEEHDAKSACGGTHLGDFQISIESGEIIYNSFDE